MATITQSLTDSDKAMPFPVGWTLADIQHLMGGIPLNRIAISPPLGSATEADVARLRETDGKLYELEHGILVEKTMGWYIDPTTRSATVYTGPYDSIRLTASDCLTGGRVLPGFSLSLQSLFEKADQQRAKQAD